MGRNETWFGGPEGAALRLREVTQVYANLRPCGYFAAGNSLLGEELVCSWDEVPCFSRELWSYKRSGIERVIRIAAHLAIPKASPKKTVISSEKANVLAGSRLRWKVVQETMNREFPDVEIVHQLGIRPTFFNGFIPANNKSGELLSDLAGVIPGTLGVLPSACFADIPIKQWGDKPVKGFYEPVHGSAPDIAGQGTANPIGAILSAALMLRYSFEMEEEATAIEKAVNLTLDAGLRTKVMKGTASTTETGDVIRKTLLELLNAQVF
ncbi:hypothetical protein PENANT_c002G06491 [Penicillium antarcticum]|uniref:Isopropylmalate dehydrogenase-like domain-containing protein n=1 Tax=Penicillium antarcticum TaxID=416450 RepID=A0A1V6QJK4_9EURO|nr:hypothetical protein PENANT_c002G06491 [Penicillium antarcticum]